MDSRTENDSWQDLADALAQLGIESEHRAGRPDLRVKAGRKWLSVDLSHAAVPTIGSVQRLVGEAEASAARPAHVLVADRLSRAVRDRLREAGWGWLDRRGHVRLWAPEDGVRIDTEVRPLRWSRDQDYREPLETRVGMEVAICLLLKPNAGVSVRALARELGRAPSAVSTTLKRLREAALVTDKHMPLIPELFDEVARAWAPRRVPLARAPGSRDGRSFERLAFNFDDPATPGWALTDTLAASHYGAHVVVGREYPPDFYVPSERILREAIGHFGLAHSYELRGCTVSVPAVVGAVIERVAATSTGVLLARPLFVALELARDRSRGREILATWDPPEGSSRVW